jgi:hypothetical protein
MILDDGPDPVEVPRAPAARWIEILLWVFMLSFAFDYRADVSREATGDTGGIDQLIFLAVCLSSAGALFLLGWRWLIVRPGAWILLLWGGLLVFLTANAFVHGVQPSRSLRTGLPFGLCLAGIMAAHIAGCAGIRPSRIVAPVFAAAVINIIWRIAQGFLFKGVSLESVRVEVLSPATNWMAAWIGCALLLRGRFHWTILLGCGVLVTGILVTVTRALIFPVAASTLAAGIALLFGIAWGAFFWSEVPKKFLPIGLAVLVAIAALGVAAAAFPTLVERWSERLFHHASDRNITQDVSWMTRRAEAEDIMKILAEDKTRFVTGMGIGASYTWSQAYLPELYLVYPRDAELGDDVWFAGHSTWTYALFSGGIIGLLGHLLLFGGTALNSLRCAAANARLPGPDFWLAFLPFIATAAFLSETATSNPFYERLAGMIYGVMAGLPQAFHVRAGFLPRLSAPA